MELRLNRVEIEARILEMRAAHPGRDEFVAAVREFSESLHADARTLLGEVLLIQQPETGGFDVISQRLERGGWMKRTMRKIEESERRRREQKP
jgi:hypothetical protein